MSFTVEEFSPSNPRLIIDGKEYFYSLITLQKEVFFIKKYGSTQKMLEALNKSSLEIFAITWELVDKSQWNFKYGEFVSFLSNCKEDKKRLGAKLSDCFYDAVNLSNPIIKNIKRHQEAQKIAGIKTNSSPCYGVYFDRISKRYGKSLEEFMNLTLRQLHILLKVSEDEAYKELEIQAQLRDKKLKERPTFNEATIEEEKAHEEQGESAISRLQAAYKLGISLEEYDKRRSGENK